jgi:hydrogenase-4 membrane subunit HyfE
MGVRVSVKPRVVHYSAHAVLAALVFVFWTLPMILFCVVVWRRGSLALTVGFLLGVGASALVLYLPRRVPPVIEFNGASLSDDATEVHARSTIQAA